MNAVGVFPYKWEASDKKYFIGARKYFRIRRQTSLTFRRSHLVSFVLLRGFMYGRVLFCSLLNRRSLRVVENIGP